jgi:flap endonuclease-1
MGIKLLNTFLRSRCKKGIQKISLKELSNKSIVIDTSIYLYRYHGKTSLIENFYHMCLLFRDYNITPLFVFDGKPPEEKMDELQQRKKAKQDAKNEYRQLKETMKTIKDKDMLDEIEQQLSHLKKQFIKVRYSDIQSIKALFHNMGITYIDAHGESDMLCAHYVNSGKVYACMSEDMDMFAYQCPRIIRYFSILNEECIMYDTSVIVRELSMNLNEFKQLCILSGTDYNKTENNIFHYYNTYVEFKNKYKSQGLFRNGKTFLEYIDMLYSEFDREKFDKVFKLFTVKSDFNDKFDGLMVKNTDMKYDIVKNILKENNFIFV